MTEDYKDPPKLNTKNPFGKVDYSTTVSKVGKTDKLKDVVVKKITLPEKITKEISLPNKLESFKAAAGPKGDTGAKGDTGQMGPAGRMGTTGPAGPIGPIGLTGAVGPKGDRGPTGLSGPKGDKGDKGDTGPAGKDAEPQLAGFGFGAQRFKVFNKGTGTSLITAENRHAMGLKSLAAGTGITITDSGTGTLTFASTGGGGTPGGSNTQVQYNNAGAFGGSAELTFTGTKLISGTTNAGNITILAADDGGRSSGLFVVDKTALYGAYIGPSSIDGITNNSSGVPNGWGNFYVNYYSTGFLSLANGGGAVVTGFGSPIGFTGVTPNFQLLGTTQANSTLVTATFSTTANPKFISYRSRNAGVGNATVLQSGDVLFDFTHYGAQQTGTFTNQSPAAQTRVVVDGVVTSGASGDMPGKYIWATTADGSSTLTDRMSLNSAGQFTLGNGASPLAFGGFAVGAQLQGTTQANGAFAMAMFNASTQPEFIMYRSRNGTIGSATALVSGDGLGRWSWYGASNTGTFSGQVQSVAISASVDGTVTTTSMPGKLALATCAAGGSFATTRLTIDSAGLVNIVGLTASQFIQTDASKNLVSYNLFGGSNVWTGTNTLSGALLDVTNSSNIRFSAGSYIYDASNNISIDVNSGLLNSSGNPSVDFQNRTHYDINTVESLNWDSRQLYDSFGNTAFDYSGRILYYDSGASAIVINNGELWDSSNKVSVGFNARKAYDPTGAITMMDWNMVQNASAFLSFDTSGNPFFTQSIHAQSNVYVTNLLNVATLNASGVVGTDAAKNLISIAAPTIFANTRFAAQTAAKSCGAHTVPAVDTTFQVSANINVTTATAHNFTVTCTYTDETNTSRVLTFGFTQLTGATLLSAITNITGAGPYESPMYHIRCKASSTITIQSTGTFTTVTYNIEERIISLGA